EKLLQLQHHLIGTCAFERFKVRRHELLPSRIDLLLGHAGQGCLKVFRSLQVAEEQTVFSREQGIVVPPGSPQSVKHLGPNALVLQFVILELPFLNLQHKGNSLHPLTSTGFTCRQEEATKSIALPRKKVTRTQP